MKTSNHKEIYDRVKSVLLERFPIQALYINDSQETIFLNGMVCFDYKCHYVLIITDNFYGSGVLSAPIIKYNPCDDRVEIYQNNGEHAYQLTQYDSLQNPTIEQINKVCDDIIYQIKKVKNEMALSKIKEDFE